MELLRVAFLHRLLEDSLRRRARRYLRLAHDALTASFRRNRLGYLDIVAALLD